MSYTVKTIIPSISSTGGTSQMQTMVQSAIDEHSAQGWEFISMESVETTVNDNGCFGFNAKSYRTVILILIFKK